MRVARPSVRVLAATLLPILLATCTQDTLGPIGHPGSAALAIESIAPNVSQFAGLTITQVRGVVTKLDPKLDKIDTLKNRLFPFPASSNTLTIDLTFELNQPRDSVDVEIDYLAGTLVVFSGSQRVEVRQGPPGTTPPVPVAVTYVGPGANAVSLVVSPVDSVVAAGGTLPFRVTAADGQGANIPLFYVSWSSSSTANPIDANGLLHAGTARATVTITARTPSGITNSTTVTVLPAASSVVKISGDAQTGLVSTGLAQPLVVEVRGTDNLPIPGVTVAFAAVTGAGTVDTASVVTGANGQAGTTVRLGATAGAQTFTATVTGAPTVSFNETATPNGPITATWTGAVSTDWFVAGNWSPATVPGAADDVTVPTGTPNAPLLSADDSIQSLTVATGVSLSLGSRTLTVGGNTLIAGSVVATTGSLQLSGGQLRGVVPSLTVTGAVVLTGSATIGGNLTITGAGASFDLAGNTASVSGNLSIQAAGRLIETNPASGVLVSGSATFDGASESGFLTAGTLAVLGNFTQAATSSGESYLASGSHQTTLSGTNPTVAFATPGGLANQSRFQDLFVTGNGTVTQGSGITVLGTLRTTAAAGVTFHGTIAGGRFLQFGDIVPSGPLVFDNIRVIVSQTGGGAPFTLHDATFQGLASTSIQLTVQHPGVATPIVLDHLSFSVTPTGAGLYLAATDNNPGDGLPLTLNFTNVTPATPSGLFTATGGAVVNWPVSGAKTWLGTTSAWTTASNWSPAGVPSASDDVTIPATANNPTTTTGGATRDLTVAAGATLSITSGTFTSSGNINAAGSIVVDTLAADFEPDGTAKTIQGNIQQAIILGTYTASGPLNIGVNLFVQNTPIGADLDVAGQTVTIGRDLLLQSLGTITMTNAAGVLSIGRNARFTGGSTAGKLTAGRIDVAGNLTQDNSGCACAASNSSFSPSGTQTTRLTGVAAQTVDIFNSGLGASLSHFNNLDVSGKAGVVSFARLATTFVAGTLISNPAGAPATFSTSAGARLQAASVNVNGLVFQVMPLRIGGGALTAFNRVTFQAFATSDTQLVVANPGAATPSVFDQLSFLTPPTGAGLYLLAIDSAALSPFLTINLTAPNPATPGGFAAVSGGAVINWPPAAPTFTWIGTFGTNWQTATNWSTGTVPGAGATVVINPAATQPILSASTSIGDLTVNNGATLTLNAVGLTITGALSVVPGGTITKIGNGSIGMHGTTIGGTFGVDVSVNGPITVAAPLTLTGVNTLFIISGGQVNLGGHTVVTPRFTTQGSGTLMMVNPIDTLNATQLAAFAGGATTGLITAGVIAIGDTLVQFGGTSPASFSASGTNKVLLNGTAGYLNFSNPGTSNFQDLEVSPTAGTVQLATNLFINGSFLRPVSAGTLQLDSLIVIVQGDAIAPGTITATSGGFALGGLLHNVRGNFPGTTAITGNRMLTGTTTMGTVGVSAGILTVNGQRLTATNLLLTGTGTLGMTNPLDTVVVSAITGFQGGDETGLLTNGAILAGGNFIQGPGGSPAAFNASGNHAVVLNGAAGQQVHFTNPGATASHFQNVVIANPSAAGVSVDSVFVLGSAAFLPALPQAARVIHGLGAGSRLVLSNFNITQTTFDDLAVSTPIDGSVVLTKFDSVTFAGTTSTDTMLTINNNGSGGPFTIRNLIFQVTPTGQGAYLRANDVDLTANGQLILNLFAPTPPTTASFVQQVNGALVNWPAVGSTITWTGGSGNSDWNTGGNWSTGTVPTGSDSVIVQNSTTTPSLVSAVSVGAINITSGTITVNGQTLAVARTFATTGTGTLTMTNAAGQVTVGGNALFNGGDETGRLTAGTLAVGGNFTQGNTTSQSSFAAGGSHTTSFNGTAAQTVTIPDTVLSFFHDLQISNTTGVAVGNLLQVQGSFTLAAGARTTAVTAGLDGFSVLGSVQTGAGSSLAAGRLFVTTTLTVAGSYAVTSTLFLGTGQTIPVLPYVNLFNRGTATTAAGTMTLSNSLVTQSGVLTLGGPMTATGDIDVFGGDLILAGQTLQTPANFSVSAAGTMTMTNVADRLTVGGDVLFQGGSETGRLTAGILQVGGNFTETQLNSPTAFQASATHTTVFATAAGTQTIAMDNPGPSPTGNHFGNVTLNPVASVTLSGTPMFVAATFTSTGAGSVVHGNGSRIQTATTNVSGMIFDNTPLQINSPTTPAGLVLDNSTFQNMNPATDQLDIILPGAATPYVLNNLVFSTTPITGVYLFASDILADANLLTVALAGPTPATPGTRTSTSGGAVIDWPQSAPTITWTGGSGTSDWNTPGNWSTGTVPTASDSVVIVASTTTPSLTGPISAGAINVTSGTITVNGQSLNVARTFATTGTGTLTMTNAAGQLLIGGNASFGGGSTAATLTAGTIDVAGNFTQAGTALSFTPSATGTLLVRFNGGTPHTVAFNSSAPTSAQPDFQNLEILGTADVNFTTGFLAHGAFALNSAVTATCGTSCQVDSTVSSVAGSTISFPYLYFGGATMDVQGTYAVTGTGFIGTNQSIPNTLAYTNVDVYNSATVDNALSIPGDLNLLPGYGTPLLTLNSSVDCNRFAARAGTVVLNGNSLTSAGNTITATSGTITMTNPSDQLNIGGDASFAGASESGLLTAGTMTLNGNFAQSAVVSTLSFAPSGSFETVMASSGPQTADFGSPGAGAAGSHFQVLDLSNASGGVSLTVNTIADSLISTNPEALLLGGGSSLTVRRVFINGLTVDNAPIIIDEQGSAPTTELFNNVTFQNMATASTVQLTLLGPGVGTRNLTFNSVNFTPLSVAGVGAFYVRLQPSIGSIVLDVASSNESPGAGGNGPAFSLPQGNGAINWP